MSRRTWILIALASCLACLCGFGWLDVSARAMSGLAATGKHMLNPQTLELALWLDFVFVLAYGSLFGLWLNSASAAFAALSNYYTPKQAAGSSVRTQTMAMRSKLLTLFSKLTLGAWFCLALTVFADVLENFMALKALAHGSGFGAWASTATIIKLLGFALVLGYCLFTTAVRGLWRVKPIVNLTFAQILAAERRIIDPQRADTSQGLAGLAISGAAFAAQPLRSGCCKHWRKKSC